MQYTSNFGFALMHLLESGMTENKVVDFPQRIILEIFEIVREISEIVGIRIKENITRGIERTVTVLGLNCNFYLRFIRSKEKETPANSKDRETIRDKTISDSAEKDKEVTRRDHPNDRNKDIGKPRR